MMHADGISYEGDILDLGMEKKFVARTGAWFRYGDMQLGQGKEKAREFLKANPEIAEEIKQKIMAAGGMDDMPVSKAVSSDDDGDAGDEF
jgi:recombination protein RecA